MRSCGGQRHPMALQRRPSRRCRTALRHGRETYGKDLITGAPLEPTEYRAMNPHGKAIIKAAEYVPPHEPPSRRYPYALITGRTVYHFHTRTKTGRTPQLNAAAPQVWVEISAPDARSADIAEGDLVEIRTARGCVVAAARITGIRRGVVFLPFHYGYWDADGSTHHRAANELTLTDWDPVSKQPIFKTAAASVRRISAGHEPSPAPTTTASAPSATGAPATVGAPTVDVSEHGAKGPP